MFFCLPEQLWRVSESIFQFRTSQGQFLTCNNAGSPVTATAESVSSTETFYLERNSDNNRVHLKLKSGTYIQVSDLVPIVFGVLIEQMLV